MALPKFLQPYLASYDLKALDIKEDEKLIITEVLNKGDYHALEWLSKNYSKKDIEKVVSDPVKGMWFESVLRYWVDVLKIDISKEKYEKSLVKLNAY